MGAGKLGRDTSNVIQGLLTSFDFNFINKSGERDIHSHVFFLMNILKRPQRAVAASHFCTTSRLLGSLKTSTSEFTNGAGLYKCWP